MRKLFLKIPSSNKAKEDIDIIMQQEGFENVAVSCASHNAIVRFFCKLLSVLMLIVRVNKGDVILVQYPFKKYYSLVCRLTHAKGGKVITLIHDLGCCRRRKLTEQQEVERLSNTDVLIVHNEAMMRFLQQIGYKKPMVTLGIFDYLAPTEGRMPSKDEHETWDVVYAGALAKRKNEFLYALDDSIKGWKLNIHGRGLDENEASGWKNIVPRGFIYSDDFIKESVGHFGLVWDGSSIDECAGEWGGYLRINNPHKTSFYLRAGKPVIMWREAALAPFVLSEGVGIAVASLKEIGDVLSRMTQEEYRKMCDNAMVMSRRQGEGTFFKEAFKKAEELL